MSFRSKLSQARLGTVLTPTARNTTILSSPERQQHDVSESPEDVVKSMNNNVENVENFETDTPTTDFTSFVTPLCNYLNRIPPEYMIPSIGNQGRMELQQSMLQQKTSLSSNSSQLSLKSSPSISTKNGPKSPSRSPNQSNPKGQKGGLKLRGGGGGKGLKKVRNDDLGFDNDVFDDDLHDFDQNDAFSNQYDQFPASQANNNINHNDGMLSEAGIDALLMNIYANPWYRLNQPVTTSTPLNVAPTSPLMTVSAQTASSINPYREIKHRFGSTILLPPPNQHKQRNIKALENQRMSADERRRLLTLYSREGQQATLAPGMELPPNTSFQVHFCEQYTLGANNLKDKSKMTPNTVLYYVFQPTTSFCADLKQFESMQASHDYNDVVEYCLRKPHIPQCCYHLSYNFEYWNKIAVAFDWIRFATCVFERALGPDLTYGLFCGKVRFLNTIPTSEHDVLLKPNTSTAFCQDLPTLQETNTQLVHCFTKIFARYAHFLTKKASSGSAFGLTQLISQISNHTMIASSGSIASYLNLNPLSVQSEGSNVVFVPIYNDTKSSENDVKSNTTMTTTTKDSRSTHSNPPSQTNPIVKLINSKLPCFAPSTPFSQSGHNTFQVVPLESLQQHFTLGTGSLITNFNQQFDQASLSFFRDYYGVKGARYLDVILAGLHTLPHFYGSGTFDITQTVYSPVEYAELIDYKKTNQHSNKQNTKTLSAPSSSDPQQYNLLSNYARDTTNLAEIHYAHSCGVLASVLVSYQNGKSAAAAMCPDQTNKSSSSISSSNQTNHHHHPLNNTLSLPSPTPTPPPHSIYLTPSTTVSLFPFLIAPSRWCLNWAYSIAYSLHKLESSYLKTALKSQQQQQQQQQRGLLESVGIGGAANEKDNTSLEWLKIKNQIDFVSQLDLIPLLSLESIVMANNQPTICPSHFGVQTSFKGQVEINHNIHVLLAQQQQENKQQQQTDHIQQLRQTPPPTRSSKSPPHNPLLHILSTHLNDQSISYTPLSGIGNLNTPSAAGSGKGKNMNGLNSISNNNKFKAMLQGLFPVSMTAMAYLARAIILYPEVIQVMCEIDVSGEDGEGEKNNKSKSSDDNNSNKAKKADVSATATTDNEVDQDQSVADGSTTDDNTSTLSSQPTTTPLTTPLKLKYLIEMYNNDQNGGFWGKIASFAMGPKTNQYLDKAVLVYTKRSASLWKQSNVQEWINGGIEAAYNVVMRYNYLHNNKNNINNTTTTLPSSYPQIPSSQLHNQMAELFIPIRNTVYCNEYYTKYQHPLKSLEQSDYCDDVVSFDTNTLFATNDANPQDRNLRRIQQQMMQQGGGGGQMGQLGQALLNLAQGRRNQAQSDGAGVGATQANPATAALGDLLQNGLTGLAGLTNGTLDRLRQLFGANEEDENEWDSDGDIGSDFFNSDHDHHDDEDNDDDDEDDIQQSPTNDNDDDEFFDFDGDDSAEEELVMQAIMLSRGLDTETRNGQAAASSSPQVATPSQRQQRQQQQPRTPAAAASRRNQPNRRQQQRLTAEQQEWQRRQQDGVIVEDVTSGDQLQHQENDDDNNNNNIEEEFIE